MNNDRGRFNHPSPYRSNGGNGETRGFEQCKFQTRTTSRNGKLFSYGLLDVEPAQYLIASFQRSSACCQSFALGEHDPLIEALFHSALWATIVTVQVDTFFPIILREAVVAVLEPDSLRLWGRRLAQLASARQL